MKNALLSAVLLLLLFCACKKEEIPTPTEPEPEEPIQIDSIPMQVFDATEMPEFFQNPVFSHISVAPDGRVWVIGRVTVNNTTLAVLAVYDPTTDDWLVRIDQENRKNYDYFYADGDNGYYIMPEPSAPAGSTIAREILHISADFTFSVIPTPEYIGELAINSTYDEYWMEGSEYIYQVMENGQMILYERDSLPIDIVTLRVSETGDVYGFGRQAVARFDRNSGWVEHLTSNTFQPYIDQYNITAVGGSQIAVMIEENSANRKILIFDRENEIETIPNPFLFPNENPRFVYTAHLKKNALGYYGVQISQNDILRFQSSIVDSVFVISPFNSILETNYGKMLFDLAPNGDLWFLARSQIARVKREVFVLD